MFFFFKQKTAYEMRISDWSSDVCSSDLGHRGNVCEIEPAAEGSGTATRETSQSVRRCRFEQRPAANAAQNRGSSQAFLRFFNGQIGRASCRERVCQYV